MPCTNAQHYISDYEHGLAQLRWACRCLGLSVAVSQLEQWATAMVQSFSGPGRYFHGPEHSFNLANKVSQTADYQDDGIAVLAALFHDTVYSHIDGGLSPAIAAVLRPLMKWNDDSFSLTFRPYRAAPASEAVCQVTAKRDGSAPCPGRLLVPVVRYDIAALVTFLFGWDESCPLKWAEGCLDTDALAVDGTHGTPTHRLADHNEYLSALWASQLLASVLSPGQIAEMAVAIEATIPFRGAWQGGAQSDRRYERLTEANKRFELGLSELQIQTAIHRSVHLTNCDLESFAAEDPVYFLDQTWLLLPELNPSLRNPHTYRAEDYRWALQRMEAFMARLNPGQIFQQFQAHPSPALHRAWSQRADYNLEVARLYLMAKVVAIGLIEALHEGESGHLPLAQMLGQLSSIYGTSAWEQRFPVWPVSQPLQSTLEFKVLQVAEEGRITPCSFDSLRSPLTAMLIRSIGFERISQLRARMQLFFDGKIDAEALLRGCEAKVIQATSQILQPLS